MALDYGSILYGPIYDVLGVEATLNPNTSPASVAITVIDKTKGVEVEDGAMQSIRPVAAVRVEELTDNGLTVNDVNGGTITFNDKTWNIKMHITVPSPTGEGKGELYLVLSE